MTHNNLFKVRLSQIVKCYYACKYKCFYKLNLKQYNTYEHKHIYNVLQIKRLYVFTFRYALSKGSSYDVRHKTFVEV